MLSSHVELTDISNRLQQLSADLQHVVAKAGSRGADERDQMAPPARGCKPSSLKLTLPAPTTAALSALSCKDLAGRVFDVTFERRFLACALRQPEPAKGPPKKRNAIDAGHDKIVRDSFKKAKADMIATMMRDRGDRWFWAELAALRGTHVGRLLFEGPLPDRDHRYYSSDDDDQQRESDEATLALDMLAQEDMVRPEWFLWMHLRAMDESSDDDDDLHAGIQGYHQERKMRHELAQLMWQHAGPNGTQALVDFFNSSLGQVYSEILREVYAGFDVRGWRNQLKSDLEAYYKAHPQPADACGSDSDGERPSAQQG